MSAAARQGHLAHEAAAAAQDIASLRLQEAQYQNSPLKAFGAHDDATLARMRNSMPVGNVTAGVICADGRLGYGHPVGGDIAYEKQISISGVGFDIGCGNMAVRLDTRSRQSPVTSPRLQRTWQAPSRLGSAAATRAGRARLAR